MRIFSGIRASGEKTFGNYSGGFRQYAATQEQGEGFFCIVDLHSITTAYEPDDLREAPADGVEAVAVGPLRLVLRGEVAPGRARPRLGGR